MCLFDSMASRCCLPKIEGELVRIVEPFEAVEFNVAGVAAPFDTQRLAVIVVMPVAGIRLAAHDARAALDQASLHGSAESSMCDCGIWMERLPAAIGASK